METRTEQLILFLSESAKEAEEKNDLKLAETLDRVADTLIERTAFFSPQFFYHMVVFSWRFSRYVLTRYVPTFAFHMIPHMWNYLMTLRDQGKDYQSMGSLMSAFVRSISDAYEDTSLSQPAKKIFEGTLEGKEYNPGEYLTPGGQLKKQKFREYLTEQGLSAEEVNEMIRDKTIREIHEKVIAEMLKRRGYKVNKGPKRQAMLMTAASGNVIKVAADFVKNRIIRLWAPAVFKKHGDNLINYVRRDDKKGFAKKFAALLKAMAMKDSAFKTKLFLAVRKVG